MVVRPHDALVALALTVRKLTVRDLPAVMEIENEAYNMPWTEATFRSLLRRRDADLFGAEIADRIVGYSVQWTVADQGELGNIAVHADWRRRGVAHRLLEAVLARARERGVRELFLEVRPSNESAQRLYGDFGFKRVGRRRNYYSAPREDALVLRLAVPPAPTDPERSPSQ